MIKQNHLQKVIVILLKLKLLELKFI